MLATGQSGQSSRAPASPRLCVGRCTRPTGSTLLRAPSCHTWHSRWTPGSQAGGGHACLCASCAVTKGGVRSGLITPVPQHTAPTEGCQLAKRQSMGNAQHVPSQQERAFEYERQCEKSRGICTVHIAAAETLAACPCPSPLPRLLSTTKTLTLLFSLCSLLLDPSTGRSNLPLNTRKAWFQLSQVQYAQQQHTHRCFVQSVSAATSPRCFPHMTMQEAAG